MRTDRKSIVQLAKDAHPVRCALYAQETASCLAGVAYVLLMTGVAPAVKAESSMVHFGARQLAWSRALSVVSLVESVGGYPD